MPVLKRIIVNKMEEFIPPFEDPSANAQRRLTFFVATSMMAMGLACAYYAYFVIETRSGAFAIAAVCWLPIFCAGLRTGTYAYKIEKIAKEEGAESAKQFYPHARNVSLAFFAVGVAIIVGLSTLIL